MAVERRVKNQNPDNQNKRKTIWKFNRQMNKWTNVIFVCKYVCYMYNVCCIIPIRKRQAPSTTNYYYLFFFLFFFSSFLLMSRLFCVFFLFDIKNFNFTPTIFFSNCQWFGFACFSNDFYFISYTMHSHRTNWWCIYKYYMLY